MDHPKQLLATKTMLVYPDFEKTFHVYCDASDYGLSVVDFQYDSEDIAKPLYFYSRKFHGAQLNYSVVHMKH